MNESLTEFKKEVLKVLRRVFRGKAAVYGDIATVLGMSAAAMAAGNALNKKSVRAANAVPPDSEKRGS